MDYDFITNVESCHIELPALLYYSHFSSIIVLVLFGVFIFLKSKKSLIGKILLLISSSFSLWAICNLIVWITFDSIIYSFFWSFFESLSILFYFLVLYFTYVFIREKDVSLKNRIIFLLLFLPVLILSSTKYYLIGFDAGSCDAIMNEEFLYYVYFLKGLSFFTVLFLIISSLAKYQLDKVKRIKIFIVGIGIILLLSSFLVTQYFGDLVSADLYTTEFYGLFAIDIFLGFLSYLILKYQAFDIKVIAAQFLTVTVWIAVFSQFFIVQELSNQILTGATLGLVTIFGYMLFKAIKEDVTLTEQLRVASGKLAVLNAKLKEIDAAKSEFISIASHQLRTPLTSVKGYASLILENTFGKAPLRQREAVEKLYVNNEKLVLLVEDMLNASRLEAGRLEYEFEEVDMPPLVKEVVDNMQLHAKSKDLSLKYIAPLKNGLIALADKRKVAEIIANLIDNAVKYSEKGGITVSVERCELAKPVGNVKNTNVVNGAGVRVSVADTGIGLNEKELKEIFEKFKGGGENAAASPKQSASLEKIVPSLRRRGEGEVKTPDKKLSTSNFELSTNIGTGLGVYISRQMARAMGGDLHAESPGKGKGSTFILELSLVKK